MSIFDRIKKLSESRGLSLAELERKLDLSTNSIYKLKQQKPSAERIELFANYFNVSTDFILGRETQEKINQINEEIAKTNKIIVSLTHQLATLKKDEESYKLIEDGLNQEIGTFISITGFPLEVTDIYLTKNISFEQIQHNIKTYIKEFVQIVENLTLEKNQLEKDNLSEITKVVNVIELDTYLDNKEYTLRYKGEEITDKELKLIYTFLDTLFDK